MTIPASQRVKVTTLGVFIGSAILLAAIFFVGWAMNKVSSENRALHQTHQSDSVTIERLSAALEKARQVGLYEDPTLVPEAPTPKPVNNSPSSSGLASLNNWARPVHHLNATRISGPQIISTGPR